MNRFQKLLIIATIACAPMLAKADATTALTNVSTTWTAVETAGLVVLGALIVVALVKKVRRFF